MDSKDPGFAMSIWPGPAAGHILDAAYRPADQTHLLMIWPPGCLASHYGVSKLPDSVGAQLEALSAADVRQIASLAGLELSDAEVDDMRSQLSDILDRFRSLAEVPTDGVEQTGHWANIHSVTRPDQQGRSFMRDETVANAPDHDGEFFRVKPVLE